MLAEDVVRDKVSNKFCRINSPPNLDLPANCNALSSKEKSFKTKINADSMNSIYILGWHKIKTHFVNALKLVCRLQVYMMYGTMIW